MVNSEIFWKNAISSFKILMVASSDGLLYTGDSDKCPYHSDSFSLSAIILITFYSKYRPQIHLVRWFVVPPLTDND